MEKITFAGGCFWCTEAIFGRVNGVRKVVSGYIGGTIKNPCYREVCTGKTGHAECVQIDFDPSKVTFEMLLELFFARRLFTLLCLLKVQILALWALNYSITPLSLVLGFVGEELFVKRLKLGVLGVEKC